MACGRIRSSTSVCHLLRGAARSVELSRSLGDPVAGLGELLFSRNNRSAIGFHGLSSCGGFRFAGIIVGTRDFFLYDKRLVSDAIPFGSGIESFVLLQLMPRGIQIRLFGIDTG